MVLVSETSTDILKLVVSLIVDPSVRLDSAQLLSSESFTSSSLRVWTSLGMASEARILSLIEEIVSEYSTVRLRVF
jgi:hypothetical protein